MGAATESTTPLRELPETDRRQALPDWIVCLGDSREALGGMVTCPQNGRTPLAECLDCHLLETVARERDPRIACETGVHEAVVSST